MMLLPRAIMRQAAARPKSVAIVDEHRTLDFVTLATESSRLASGLATNAAPGRVALLLGNRSEHLTTLIAAAQADITAVPLNPSWTDGVLAETLDRAAVRLVVTDPEGGERLRSSLPDHKLPRLVIVGSEPKDPGGVIAGDRYEWFVAAGRRCSTISPNPEGTHVVAPSGGTGGRAKSVYISHTATTARFTTQSAEFGVTPDGPFLVATPLFHGAGRSFALGHLYYGGPVRLQSTFEAARFAEAARKAVATFCVPTMIQRLVSTVREPLVESGLTLIVSGGRLGPELAEDAMDLLTPRLFNYYASVEAGPISVLSPEYVREAVETVGHPAFGVDVTVLDDESVPVHPRQTGQITVKSPGICSAIDGKDDHIGPYGLLTDDYGWMNEEGRLIVVGRADDAIISGGVNVQPQPIEDAIATHPSVAAAAVVGLPDETWGEQVVGAVVPQEGQDFDIPEILRHMSRALATYERPKRLIVVRELPLTSVGKIDRATLRRQLAKPDA